MQGRVAHMLSSGFGNSNKINCYGTYLMPYLISYTHISLNIDGTWD